MRLGADELVQSGLAVTAKRRSPRRRGRKIASSVLRKESLRDTRVYALLRVISSGDAAGLRSRASCDTERPIEKLSRSHKEPSGFTTGHTIGRAR